MKRFNTLLLAFGIFIFASVFVPKGQFVWLIQNIFGLTMNEIILDDRYKLITPDEWITFLAKGKHENMIFGFIPYEFFPGKKLDEETLTNLIVFYQVPHQEGYLSIIFSKMDDKDWIILNHMKKELDLSGQRSVVVQGIKNSICLFHARKCYQAEAARNVVMIYLPEQGLQFSLPKEISPSIENLIAIKER